MVNGARKGSAFERAICRRLSLWLSDHVRDDILWRTPGSGARFTTRTRQAARTIKTSLAHAGDIQATEEEAIWFVDTFLLECKHYAGIDWDKTMRRKKSSNLRNWWVRLVADAKKIEREPFLLMKANRQAELVCLTSFGHQLLSEAGPLPALVTFPQENLTVVDFTAILMTDASYVQELAPRFHRRAEERSRAPKLRRPR